MSKRSGMLIAFANGTIVAKRRSSRDFPTSLAAKLRAQHAEALEIAARLPESLSAGQTADAIYLARRFLAIVQHNIIEEERDVFPLFP